MHGRAFPLGPSRPMCWTVPHTGAGIDALPNYGQFTTRSSPVPGLSTAVNSGGASLLALCTVAQPSPGTSPLITPYPFNAEPSRAHDPGQIEPYLEPSRDEALRVGSHA